MNMKNGNRILALTAIVLLMISNTARAQQPVQFDFSKEDKGAGHFVLKITAKPSPGVKLFSVEKVSDELPVNTVIGFDSAFKKYLQDSIKESGTSHTEKSAALNGAVVKYYTDSVTWEQALTLNEKDSFRLKGLVNYYYEKDGGVQSGEEKISNEFQFVKTANNSIATIAPVNPYLNKGFWLLFIFGIGAGLIAFISPCVYALVPVTVSLFLKRSKTPLQGRTNVLVYAASIMVIYTMIGVIATLAGGGTNFWYELSTNWIFNLVLFAMFVVFGISFLGAFEINLPAAWANKLDSKANSKSFAGIFFMAFTLVVVSFSCTGNFVTTILGVAGKGGSLGPLGGMFGFGFGLAAPFLIFAFFPKLLTVLTKSGGWQNALKVTLGFLELALALKFLSNVDADRNWRILDREIFLVCWISIFLVLGLYLLGKIRFKHDSGLPKNDFDLEYIPIPRLMLALTSIAFAIYMIPGLWGAPLKGISGFLPSPGTQDFKLNGSNNEPVKSGTVQLPLNGETAAAPVKYVSSLSRFEPGAASDNHLTIYYDYDEALTAAKKLKKPLMLDFTGIQCVNCRKFEGEIWTDKEVGKIMKNDFVIVSLFTDFNDELPDNEKFDSPLLGSKAETVGDKNKDLQLKLIGTVAQPNYVFLDNNGKLLAENGYGYDPTTGAKEFIAHLEKVKQEFQKRNP